MRSTGGKTYRCASVRAILSRPKSLGEAHKNHHRSVFCVIRNGRVVVAGILLLFASMLLAVTAIRTDLSLPVGMLAGAMILFAAVTLVRAPLRRPRPT